MKRILLKLSGEALAGEKKTGFDEETVRISTEQRLARSVCWPRSCTVFMSRRFFAR